MIEQKNKNFQGTCSVASSATTGTSAKKSDNEINSSYNKSYKGNYTSIIPDGTAKECLLHSDQQENFRSGYLPRKNPGAERAGFTLDQLNEFSIHGNLQQHGFKAPKDVVGRIFKSDIGNCKLARLDVLIANPKGSGHIKYLQTEGTGERFFKLFLANPGDPSVILVEGIYKALAAYVCGKNAIAYSGILGAFENYKLHPSLVKILNPFTDIQIGFDIDKNYDQQLHVEHYVLQLAKLLEGTEGKEVTITQSWSKTLKCKDFDAILADHGQEKLTEILNNTTDRFHWSGISALNGYTATHSESSEYISQSLILELIEAYKVIFIKAPMGAGKTHSLAAILKFLEDYGCLIISPLRVLGRQICKDLKSQGVDITYRDDIEELGFWLLEGRDYADFYEQERILKQQNIQVYNSTKLLESGDYTKTYKHDLINGAKIHKINLAEELGFKYALQYALKFGVADLFLGETPTSIAEFIVNLKNKKSEWVITFGWDWKDFKRSDATIFERACKNFGFQFGDKEKIRTKIPGTSKTQQQTIYKSVVPIRNKKSKDKRANALLEDIKTKYSRFIQNQLWVTVGRHLMSNSPVSSELINEFGKDLVCKTEYKPLSGTGRMSCGNENGLGTPNLQAFVKKAEGKYFGFIPGSGDTPKKFWEKPSIAAAISIRDVFALTDDTKAFFTEDADASHARLAVGFGKCEFGKSVLDGMDGHSMFAMMALQAMLADNPNALDFFPQIRDFVKNLTEKQIRNAQTCDEFKKLDKKVASERFRSAAKTLFYSVLNGAQADKMRKVMMCASGSPVSVEVGVDMFNKFWNLYQGIAQYIKQILVEAETNSVNYGGIEFNITTLPDGIKLLYARKDGELATTNIIACQWSRSEATALKKIMASIEEIPKEWGATLINMVHDEVGVTCHKEHWQDAYRFTSDRFAKEYNMYLQGFLPSDKSTEVKLQDKLAKNCNYIPTSWADK